MTVVPAYKARGDGPVLLFLHGIGGNQDSFDAQLPHFADRYHAVAWDMPGYGATPLPAEPLTFDLLADAAASLIDALAVEQAHIVGHSMGGMVAQSLVRRHPGRVASLALTCTSPAFGKPGGDFQAKFLAARLQPLDEGRTPADFADALVDGMWGDFDDAEAKARAAGSMKALTAATYRAALNCIVTFDERENLPHIACPTLCLAGEKDTTAPPAVLEKMAVKIPGAVYGCMAGVGHLANIERPDLFNGAIDAFLEAL
ncbi:MAG: alpha/beta fold hydrolase [Alphaproteobacteria bacterium]